MPPKSFTNLVVMSLIIGILFFWAQQIVSFFPVSIEKIEVAPQEEYEPPFKRVDLVTLLSARNSRSIVLLDLRSADVFEYAHIPGAVNWDLGLPDAGAPLPPFSGPEGAAMCFLYARNGNDPLLQDAAKILHSHGVTNAYVYAGGWEEWKSCGLPVGRFNE